MDSRVLQDGGDLGEIQVVFPNHLLAFLQLDSTDIFTG